MNYVVEGMGGVISFHIGIKELTWESLLEKEDKISTVDHNLLITTLSYKTYRGLVL
jgi:hypothetical protein